MPSSKSDVPHTFTINRSEVRQDLEYLVFFIILPYILRFMGKKLLIKILNLFCKKCVGKTTTELKEALLPAIGNSKADEAYYSCENCNFKISINSKAKFCQECGASLLHKCVVCQHSVSIMPINCTECGEQQRTYLDQENVDLYQQKVSMGKIWWRKITWKEATAARGLSKNAAYFVSFIVLVFWHWMQPIFYWICLYAYWNLLDLGERYFGSIVAFREFMYLMFTVWAIVVNPAYLLIDVNATWNENKSRVFLYIFAPEKYVFRSMFQQLGWLYYILLLTVISLDVGAVFALAWTLSKSNVYPAMVCGYVVTITFIIMQLCHLLYFQSSLLTTSGFYSVEDLSYLVNLSKFDSLDRNKQLELLWISVDQEAQIICKQKYHHDENVFNEDVPVDNLKIENSKLESSKSALIQLTTAQRLLAYAPAVIIYGVFFWLYCLNNKLATQQIGIALLGLSYFGLTVASTLTTMLYYFRAKHSGMLHPQLTKQMWFWFFFVDPYGRLFNMLNIKKQYMDTNLTYADFKKDIVMKIQHKMDNEANRMCFKLLDYLLKLNHSDDIIEMVQIIALYKAATQKLMRKMKTKQEEKKMKIIKNHLDNINILMEETKIYFLENRNIFKFKTMFLRPKNVYIAQQRFQSTINLNRTVTFLQIFVIIVASTVNCKRWKGAAGYIIHVFALVLSATIIPQVVYRIRIGGHGVFQKKKNKKKKLFISHPYYHHFVHATQLHISVWNNSNIDPGVIPEVELNAEMNYGWTPIFLAACLGRVKIVESLLCIDSIDVNKTAYNGDTPLHVAASCGNKQIVKLLLKSNGIDANKKNKNGLTALDVAKTNTKSNCNAILKCLEDFGVESRISKDNIATGDKCSWPIGFRVVVSVLFVVVFISLLGC